MLRILMGTEPGAYFKEKCRLYPKALSWEDIEETKSDKFDLKMLEDAEKDLDCQEFISYEQAMKELEL